MEQKIEYLEIYNNLINFKEYGAADSNIWVIGYEENWKSLVKCIEEYKNDINSLIKGIGNNYQSEFSEEVNYNEMDCNNRDNKYYCNILKLLNEIDIDINSQRIFSTNFRPIGFKDHDLCNFLYFFNKSYNECEKDLREIRLNKLVQIWKKHPPKLNFFFISSRNEIWKDCQFFLKKIDPDFDLYQTKEFPFYHKVSESYFHFLYNTSRASGFNKNIDYLEKFKTDIRNRN